jgi:drug/metabolite transporter (DMT)-like permease
VIESRTPHTFWANVSLATAGSLWGTGFLLGKIAFREMSVAENVCFRFIFASPILFAILVRKRVRFSKKDFGLLLLASIIGVPLQFLVQFRGLKLTTVSHASLIVGTLPVLIAASSAFVFRERLTRLQWTILLLSPLGVLLIAEGGRASASSAGPTLMGDLLVLLSMAASTAMILLSKHLTHRYDPFQVTAWTLVLGTIMLLAGVEIVHPLRYRFSLESWSAAAGQGLLATAGAYLCWNWGLARVPASHAGVFLNLEPLVGTLLGVVILHETLGISTILGGLLVLGPAVYFSSREPAGS